MEDKSSEVTFRFFLPQHEEKVRIVCHAMDYFSTVCDIDELCRQKIKYGDISEETIKMLDEIRDLIDPQLIGF